MPLDSGLRLRFPMCGRSYDLRKTVDLMGASSNQLGRGTAPILRELREGHRPSAHGGEAARSCPEYAIRIHSISIFTLGPLSTLVTLR